MSGTAIAKYFASLSINVNHASVKNVDKTLSNLEKRFAKFNKSVTKDLNLNFKNLKLPTLKFKASFNELQLQKEAQQSVNRVSKLLSIKIDRFEINEPKLKKQLAGIFQRATNANRLNLRTIQGSAGGSNAYHPGRLSAAIQNYGNPAHMNLPGMNSLAGISRFGLPMGAGLGVGALAGGAAGVVGGGIVAGQQGAVALGNDQAQKEQLRTQLDVSSGQTTRAGKDAQNKEFFKLANATGTNAADMVRSYSMLMKGLTAQGLKTKEAFSLYKDISMYAKGSGATSEQLSNASYAVNQAIGKGHLSREDYATQILDALPSFSKFIKLSYANATGKKDNASFEKALGDKQITIEMMKEAFRLAAQATSGNVTALSNTVLGEQARLENMKLEEQMARTLSDDVIPGMRNYTKAQGELYKAMEPMRNQFYDLSAGILNFSASMLRASTPFVKTVGDLGTPTIPKIASATEGNRPWWNTSGGGAGPMSSDRYGMFANRDKGIGPATQAGVDRFKSLSESFKPKLGPLPMESKESALQSIREGMNQRITNNNATANITVNNTFNGVDPGQAEQDMVEVSKRVWRDSFKATITESMQNYPQTE